MSLDFYATTAQVLPVLMLALIWESRFLDRLRGERRALRRDDPVAGVLFWTRPRVRAYSIFVATVVLTGTGVAVLVLAGALPDAPVLRGALAGCLLLALATLLTRIVVDVWDATGPLGPGPAPAPTPRPASAPASRDQTP